MRKGFWNYSEPIEYRVLQVKLNSPNPEVKLHWQNAFVGENRQIVEVTYHKPAGGKEVFYIDNEDGSGIRKIERGGGPDSMSRHIDKDTFEIVDELPLISDWNNWDVNKCVELDMKVEQWQQKNHPEEFKKLEALRRSFVRHPKK